MGVANEIFSKRGFATLTVEEYADQVEEAIENRRMPVWKIYDLRLALKFVRRNRRVTNLDKILLDWAGVPYVGPKAFPSTKVLKKPKKQVKLF